MRRSVASGEAVFPFSDVDFDIAITTASGQTLNRLRRRYALAKGLFPRTGECFVLTQADIAEVAAVEPYRSSINRRCCLAIRGPAPCWPVHAIQRLESARRVVFWLERFLPAAVRGGQKRNQRKFYLEMCNALGLLQRRWDEPRISLAEVAQSYPLQAGSLFVQALKVGDAAHRLLGRKAPRIIQTFHAPGLTVLPTAESDWPRAAFSDDGIVATPECLDLLLQLQCPALWMNHAKPLSELGFEPPSRIAWIRSARRLAGPIWTRGPGFFERRNGQAEQRVELARRILDSLDAGRTPAGRPISPNPVKGADQYYREVYDSLALEAASLRRRARALSEQPAAPELAST